MHTILSSTDAPHLLPEFQKWVESEWGNVDPFTPAAGDIEFPLPILALDGKDLAGGLSFTSHAEPDTCSPAVWINTLYVAPEYRNRGLGAELVQAAEAEARQLAIDELYVFTDLYNFYEKLGWQYVKTVEESRVLSKLLKS